eukprot:3363589-Rhodomonas_salina.10
MLWNLSRKTARSTSATATTCRVSAGHRRVGAHQTVSLTWKLRKVEDSEYVIDESLQPSLAVQVFLLKRGTLDSRFLVLVAEKTALKHADEVAR